MRKTDCIIVGSGIAGVSLAWHLYQKNISFFIISNPGLSSSSLIAPGIINPITFKRMVPSWNVTELLDYSISFYNQIQNILKTDFFRSIELWHYIHNEKEMKLWLQKQPLYPRFFGDIESLRASDIPYLKKDFFYAKVLNAWRLQVKNYVQHSLFFFKSKNLFYEEVFNYEHLSIGHNGIHYQDIFAKKIVFCEGYLIKNNPYFHHIRLKPAKGELIEIETESPILPKNTVLHKTFNIIGLENNKYLIGSNYEWAELNEKPTDDLKIKFLLPLSDLFNIQYKITNHYVGIRPASIDRKPIIQKHPSLSGLYLLNGYGTKGVLLAPYSANVLTKNMF